jgi:ferrous iron transport protein B
MFVALAVLEDSGYMARAAFLLDGLMRRFGLHGKSVVPLILGFGCSVPAIMATRSIESERDRKVTIMVLPFMSCGARLPIHIMIIGAFFSAHKSLMMFAIYLIGVLIALGAALLLKRTLFRGGDEVFLMELPPYRCPTLRGVLIHAWERAAMYLKKAGTIILPICIILFFANAYPEKTKYDVDYEAQAQSVSAQFALNAAQLAALTDSGYFDDETLAALNDGEGLNDEQASAIPEDAAPEVLAAAERAQSLAAGLEALSHAEEMERLAYTVSGRIGKAVEPIFRPLGFDWKISTAMIGALAAKEVFVSQLGVLFAVGEADETSESLRAQLAENYTQLQGFCIMLFCLLSIPCVATLAIIKRELNSWGYAVAEAAGLLALAYVATLIVYQVGLLFTA